MNSIILFDGDCHFCDWNVQLILKHDHNRIFSFASLQSDIAKDFLKKHGIPYDINSLVLIENDKAYIKSSAVFRICRNLKGIYKVFYLFSFLPKFILDPFYDLIAINRYKWFGQKQKCKIYPDYIRKRFL